MANNFKRMDEIKSIIRTYQKTQSIKATARMMNVSKNTIRRYIRLLKEKGIPFSKVEGFSDEELVKVFYNREVANENDRQNLFGKRAEYWVKELRKV